MELNRIAAYLLRVAVVGVLAATATAGVTWAASHGVVTLGKKAPALTTPAPPAPLVVPDVRNLAFVFAKGALEDAGFGWRVDGSVHGYPANTVVSQTPAPGAKIVDSGAPLVVLHLARAKGYPQTGEPQDTSPYGATKAEAANLASR